MSVAIIWSLTNGGESISTAVNHGSTLSNGDTSTAIELFMRHNGSNPITNVGMYIRAVSGTYTGDFTATNDINEILGWGNQTTEDGFGGVMFNFNASTSYATGWPTYDNKDPTGGLICRTGTGDSEDNAYTLPTTTGATSSGTIQSGSSPNVRCKIRLVIPTDEDTIGTRQFEPILRFSYTS